MVSGLRSRTPKTPPERNQGENSPGAATILAAKSLQQSKRGRARGAIAKNKGKKHDTATRQLVWDAWQRCVGRNKALGGERGLRSKPGTTELQAICRLLQPPGGPLRWGQDSLEHLDAHGISIANGNLLVEDLSGAWPPRSPDLNWLDEFVWCFMVNEIRFEKANTKDELRRAIERCWAKITPEMRRNIIKHYWKASGTLDKCIAAEGKRFSKPKLSAVVDN